MAIFPNNILSLLPVFLLMLVRNSASQLQPASFNLGNAHPGSCPNVVTMIARLSCPPACSQDSSCSTTTKCCYWEGCRQCIDVRRIGGSGSNMPVVSVPSLSTGSRPGSCPSAVSMIATASCPTACSQDSSCPGNRKCCYWQGCQQCIDTSATGMFPGTSTNWNMMPSTGTNTGSSSGSLVYKRGMCPSQTSAMAGICLWNSNSCSSVRGDVDCTGTKKCCPSGCGSSCMEALSYG